VRATVAKRRPYARLCGRQGSVVGARAGPKSTLRDPRGQSSFDAVSRSMGTEAAVRASSSAIRACRSINSERIPGCRHVHGHRLVTGRSGSIGHRTDVGVCVVVFNFIHANLMPWRLVRVGNPYTVGAFHCDLLSADAMDRNPPPPADQPVAPECDKCRKPMAFATALPRVTEPGRVLVFQCADCEKLDFRPAD
jgi:hypothetical protein